MAELQSNGINVSIKLFYHPLWAGGGQPCTETSDSCGKILVGYRQIFKDNYYDFAYNIASRYPTVKHWSVWNEPNLSKYFSPQRNVGDNVMNLYMDLIMFQGHSAIKNRIPDALILGPDLSTCYDGGDGCTFTDRNWGYSTKWLANWTDTMLRYFPGFFDKFIIHNYSNNSSGVSWAVGSVWNKMVQLGQQKQIWTTEVNFRDGTCDTSEQTIANETCEVFNNMTWERASYFSLIDGHLNESCGFGLLRSRGYGFADKTFLYPAFDAIVNGVYGCD